MRTDIAKVSFDELNHYVGVFSQMGRLPLESDINEQNELVLRLLQRLAGDAIHTGSPNQGFRVDTHVLLDALDTRQGWSTTPGSAALFVDYFDHRVGDGSLVALGATAIARALPRPADFSSVNEVLIAVKAVPAAPAVFYVKDATTTHAFTMSTVATDNGWTLMRAVPGAWPVGFAAGQVIEYGFSGLTSASRYSFDFLKVDVPLCTLLLRPEHTDLFTATPTTATLTPNDDQRLWGSTSLQITGATQLDVALPAPADLSRARALLIAVQNPAAAPLVVRLTDNTAVPAHIDLTGATTTTLTTPSGTWQILRFTLPQVGAFNWSAVTTLTYRTLSASATYTFGAALVEANLAKDLVVMGGDGSAAGAGRFYGEGLAAIKEAHGTYFTQPDLPQADPAALASVAEGMQRIDWAYLDLWERPLTYIERPDLREVALEGDDTCTRRQLVAQVRLLKGVQVPLASTAAPPANAFALLPRYGHGLLSTKDKPAAVLDPCADACEPAIAGPYLGEDNRLFRVEIHRAGNIGAATDVNTALFKWSRHNGAVASSLIADAPVGVFSVQVEKPELFAVGNLIEVSDDLVELATGVYEDRIAHAKHTRGLMRRVVTVNMQTRRISWEDPTVVDPLLAPFHAALPQPMRRAAHAKITQWDGVQAGSLGDIVLLEGVVIEFGGNNLVAGDYWQFATRTVNRSVERLIDAPPRGTRHAFYPLAAIHRSRAMAAPEIVFAEDLRPRFAALPELNASGVSYDPGACAAEHHITGWDQVTTVQQAIDALCAADLTGDLKLHNKLLHGMGVICGLKLRCSKDRTQVILGKGYALDCEGNLLHQAGDMAVALVTQAQAQGLLNGAGDGDVNVWIEQGASGLTVEIEPHINQPFWQSVYEGTLIKDFFDKYVLGLVNFFKAQLMPFPDPTLPLSDQHKRVVSLINLIWQIVNSANGPYVFVSKTEHDLLEKFHQELQDFLASKTYCAMFDSLTVFPAYPYAQPTGIETMVGLFNFHRRMRAAPGNQYLVTCGLGNKVQFFDLATQQAVAVSTFPAATNATVQDVAFSDDGSQMYAVATVIQGSNVDSIFATATITAPAVAGDAPVITWGPATVVCDYKFVTLATHPKQANRLYAVAVGHTAADTAKRGVHRFTLPVIPLAPTPLSNFNATGLLAIDTNGIDAVATEISTGVTTGVFDRLHKVNVQSGVHSSPWAVVGFNDYNDLVVDQGVAWLTAGTHLHSFNIATLSTAVMATLSASVSVWRLAMLPAVNALLVSDANTYRIRFFNTSLNTYHTNVRVPLQIMPVSLAVHSNQTQVYALNMFSNTVNVLDVATVLSAAASYMAEPPVTLAAYRKQMLQAFTDLVSVLGQYFKDGFCDQFLVECPECDKDDKLYLATIHIKGNKVFNICNFSKRHYAKSFKTWGYWLSAVPILPLLKKAFAKFCCSTLVP